MKRIPQIYESTATALDGYALGSVPDSLSCKVTEERNGGFFCEMSYPANGLNASLLKVGRIMAVQPNMYDAVQPFRIATIEKDLSGTIDVTAYHISYDLSQVIVMPFTAADSDDAIQGLMDYAVPANGFTISADFTVTAAFSVTQPTPLRSLLVGSEGSLVDLYGGELRFDGWNVSLEKPRGVTRNVQIAYGKNLTGFKETDENGAYDAVVPFAVLDDVIYTLTDTSVCATAPVVYANGSGSSYGYPKAIPLDLSDKFDAAPTQAQLYTYAQNYTRRNSTQPTANYSTEYVDLAKLIGATERVDLCDTIYITVTPFRVWNLTAKVVSLTYDVLLDENAKVEVGDRKVTLADTLAETIIAAGQKAPGAIKIRNADTILY